MSKLFNNIDISIESSNVKEPGENLDEILEDDLENIDQAFDNIETATENLKILTNVQVAFESNKIGSVPYLVTVENYRPIIDSICGNLGVKSMVPCTEDFNSYFGLESSHEIALESIVETIKKVWQKIVDFFKAFWKKSMLFFKRLLKLDLDLKEYEVYVEKLIGKMKNKDVKLKDSSPISTKLPMLLADDYAANFNSNDLMSIGEAKINNINELKSKVTKLTNTITEEVKVLSNLIKIVFNSDKTKELKDIEKLLLDLDKTTDRSLIKDQIVVIIKELQKFTVSNSKNTYRIPSNILGEDLFTEVSDQDNIPNKVEATLGNSSYQETLYSFFNTSDSYSRLPKNSNIYMVKLLEVRDEHINIVRFNFIATLNPNTTVENKIEPPSEFDNVVKLYDLYKTIDSSKNKGFNKSLEELNKEVDKLLGNVSKVTQDQMSNMQSVVKLASKLPLDGNDRVDIILEKLKKISNLYKDANNQYGIVSNAIASMTKEIPINLSAIIAETKTELIKYIFNSIKRY